MEKITELQMKRAVNIIWTAAKRHDFTPDFKAYDEQGKADIYWNCIIGAVRQHYDYPKIESVFRSFQEHEDADLYESLLWLGLENCVYQKELPERPVLFSLRQSYAEAFLKAYSSPDYYSLYDDISTAHYSRVLGRPRKMSRYEENLLDELEFSADLTTDEIVERAQALFLRWFHIRAEERKKERKKFYIPGFKKRNGKGKRTRYRKFGIGIADHPDNVYGSDAANEKRPEHVLNTKLTASELREFIHTKFGKPMFSEREMAETERELCSGSHENCHLHFTYGERIDISQVQNGFEALSRQREAAQVESNKKYYQANLSQNNTSILKLTSKIQNSVLLHLQPSPIKSNSGSIIPAKVWRALELDDDRVFEKNEQDDMGELSVDILLDASTSQLNRQETVSSQGYMIAQALTKCGIPCRVMSFCSMTGFTVLRVFRDYNRPQDNDKIFEYVAHGCNRDGLAIAAAHRLMSQSGYEHKMLIVLSDVKPNDVIKIRQSQATEPTPYERQAGITNTAFEVRKARADGISVICVFTGEDEDLPSAKLVYGRDFARIQSLDKLADTVGMLIQNQIKNL